TGSAAFKPRRLLNSELLIFPRGGCASLCLSQAGTYNFDVLYTEKNFACRLDLLVSELAYWNFKERGLIGGGGLGMQDVPALQVSQCVGIDQTWSVVARGQ